MMEASSALVIIAHGSGRAAWHDVVDAALAQWRSRFGQAISIAYVGGHSDRLSGALVTAYESGARHICVLPLFIAPGGHVSKDLESAMGAFEETAPDCTVQRLGTLLEMPAVIETLGQEIARHLGSD